jgi:hypothetical protein
MNWLSSHFWQLFGGGGATLLVALLIYFLQRRERNAPTHDYFAPAPALVEPATVTAPATRDRARANIRMTGTRQARLMDMGYGVMSEDPNGGSEALIIRFTNEPKAGAVGGPVMASLAYQTNDPIDQRIIGAWVDSNGDVVRFRVDDSHNLLVGFLYERRFVTLGRQQFRGAIRTDIHEINDAKGVRVRLTDANDGHVLYEGTFRLTLDPLRITPVD